MSERTNEQWLSDLRGAPDAQAPAIEALQKRLQRGILYYLSRERSDLNHLSAHELAQMADDLSQDATLRVIQNLDTFRGDSQFTTWATRIAVRMAISDLRRARYRDFSLDDLTADGDLMPNAANPLLSAPQPGPERSAEREEVLTHIDAALAQALTERQRRALVAVVVRGVPLEIVADQLGTNRNALYKLLHDARRKLKTALESQGLSLDYVIDLFQD
jgi:RNA polymerase sigma-70 factor (ECF subfamily)